MGVRGGGWACGEGRVGVRAGGWACGEGGVGVRGGEGGRAGGRWACGEGGRRRVAVSVAGAAHTCATPSAADLVDAAVAPVSRPPAAPAPPLRIGAAAAAARRCRRRGRGGAEAEAEGAGASAVALVVQRPRLREPRRRQLQRRPPPPPRRRRAPIEQRLPLPAAWIVSPRMSCARARPGRVCVYFLAERARVRARVCACVRACVCNGGGQTSAKGERCLPAGAAAA